MHGRVFAPRNTYGILPADRTNGAHRMTIRAFAANKWSELGRLDDRDHIHVHKLANALLATS